MTLESVSQETLIVMVLGPKNMGEPSSPMATSQVPSEDVVFTMLWHVYLRPYEGTAAGPDQCEYKDDMLDNARRFMLFW